MFRQNSRTIMFLITSGLVLAGIVALLVNVANSEKMGSVAHVPAAQADSFHYGAKNLNGASPEQVGQFAIEYAQHHVKVRDTPQVVLARRIKPGDLPKLGLGCPLTMASIEEPPLMLVILKGNFDVSRVRSGSSVIGINEVPYISYVFDHWSAAHMLFQTSVTGGRFRIALNDSTLPIDESSGPMVCPTEIPTKKTLHYGDIAPTVVPPDEPEASPIPTTPPLPTPIPTEAMR